MVQCAQHGRPARRGAEDRFARIRTLSGLPHRESRESRAAESWTTADSTGNVLLHPVSPTRVGYGVLAALRGGLVTDTQLRARVSAIVGPGATPRGIARLLRPHFVAAARAHPSEPPPTVDELAKGILVYSRYYLPVPAMRLYRDGLRLPLPIEIDRRTSDWVLRSNTIRLWVRSFQAAWQPLLDRRPARLSQPDSRLVDQEARRFLRRHTSANARAIFLWSRVLKNCFASVFLVHAIVERLGAGAFAVALELMDHAVNHQIDLLGTLTAGNAVLQLLHASLSSPPAGLNAQQRTSLRRARRMLSRGIGLGGTLTTARELPETAQQAARRPGRVRRRIQAADPPGGLHRMVLGRDVLAGVVGTFTQANGDRIRGPAYGGRIAPRQFIQGNRPQLNPTNAPRLAARLSIVEAIAVNEGYLDAVRMRDRGIVSIGMQQWSAHSDLELPALLWRFKRLSPEAFFLHFGLYGLDIRPAGQDGHGNPRYMLIQVRPNRTLRDLRTWTQRRDFFGGQALPGNLTVFRTDWAARARAAAVASELFRRAEVLEAAARFDRVLREVPTIRISGQPVRLERLITSQLGVALILDAHINLPGYVRRDLQRAANAVGPLANAAALDRAITQRYETLRRTHDTPLRNRNIRRQGLDPNHGSFAGW